MEKRLKRERKILQFKKWLHRLGQWERFGFQDDGFSNLGDEPLSQDKFYISKEYLSKACETWLEGFSLNPKASKSKRIGKMHYRKQECFCNGAS